MLNYFGTKQCCCRFVLFFVLQLFQCGCFSVNRKQIEFLTPRSPSTQRKYFFIFQVYDREFPVYRSFYRILAWTRTVLRKEVGSHYLYCRVSERHNSEKNETEVYVGERKLSGYSSYTSETGNKNNCTYNILYILLIKCLILRWYFFQFFF